MDTGYKRDRGVRDDFRNFGLCLWGAVIYLRGKVLERSSGEGVCGLEVESRKYFGYGRIWKLIRHPSEDVDCNLDICGWNLEEGTQDC